MFAAVQKWTEFGSILANTSWTTEDAMAMMVAGPAVEESKESNVYMSRGFLEDVEPSPQSVAGVERSKYRELRSNAMKTDLDGHKTTGTYEAATLRQEQKPLDAKWVFSYTTNKDGTITKTKARLVTNGFSQVQDVEYFQTLAPTPSPASVKILAAVANEQGLTIFQVDVEQPLSARISTPRYT